VTLPDAPIRALLKIQVTAALSATAALLLLDSARAAAGSTGRLEAHVARESEQTVAFRLTPAGPEGLGIAVVRRTASEHGGSLERDGEAFTMRLPVSP
jgi:hypothetical protein